ncbi:MAG TPA: DUF190 domain-containing protein [Gammaproteobacteria bacterium]|jgi:PII-like signaling protein|nr:DUF190 domain-containing protein [Gammaproteobacteria bacterium]
MTLELIKVSMYINEADEWHHRPLHLKALEMLREQGLAGGTVIHAVAGFTARGGVHNSSLIDAGGRLPLVIEFIDTEAKVQKVLPLLKEMAPHRLLVQQKVMADELP